MPSWTFAWKPLPFLAAAFTASTALAADPTAGGASEEVFFQKVPVVLSATRLSQPVSESPAAITVINREMIEASGAIEIPDLFRLVPGFQVGHVNGVTSVVTYHGLTDKYARRMQVLVDGRSVYTPLFGGVEWADLPLAIEDIERIEVIRGPNGVTYGANAFAAVINIITRDPSLDRGTQLFATRGDLDTRKALVRHGGEIGKLNYRVTAGQRRDDGITPTPDDKRISLFTFRGDYRANARDSLDIQFGYNEGPRGTGDPTSLVDPAREVRVIGRFEQLRWRRVVDADEEINLQFYHNYRHAFDTFQSGLLSTIYNTTPAAIQATFGHPDQQLTVVEDTTAERYDMELTHTFRPWQPLRLVWGGELRFDRVAGIGWFGTNEYVGNRLRRLFANAEWKITPDWILNAGAMYEHNAITGDETSPRLALNHHLTRHHTLRAGITRAYRTPSLYEQRANTAYRFPDGVALDQTYKATTSLTPEKITTYELGYNGQFPAQGLTLDARLFRDTIRYLIATPSDNSISDLSGNGAYTFRNDGYAELSGADLQLEYRPTARTRFLLAYAHTYQEGRYLTKISPVTYSESLNSTPTETTNLMVIHKFPHGFEGSVSYRIVTNMEYLGGGTQPTGQYTTGDVRLAKKFRENGLRGEFACTIQNVTGAYFDFGDTAVLRPRDLFTLSLEFR